MNGRRQLTCMNRWIKSLFCGQCRGLQLSGTVNDKKRRRFTTPIVVKKTESRKRIAQIYKDMNIHELASVVEQSAEEVTRVLNEIQSKFDGSLNSVSLMKVVSEFGFKPQLINRPVTKLNENPEIDVYPQALPEKGLVPRPPIITIMGHVDHGKTTLLDCLRHSHIVETEHGGITQHIGAFSLRDKDCKMTFLDTPGHAAFAKMRERGAHSTDIVVLVVAADDGVNEQTVQSIRYAQDAQVPIVVAINKIDKENANPERAKQSLIPHGIVVEDLGGDVLCVEISALQNINVDKLKEAVLIQAEDLSLRSTEKGNVEGVVIESETVTGIGRACTMIVHRGLLKKGAALVAGRCWARVRLLRDEFGRELLEAGPSTPVRVFGWRDSLPCPGDRVIQVQNEQRAQEVVKYRANEKMFQKAAEDWLETEKRREDHRKHYLENRQKLLSVGIRAGSTLRLIDHKEHHYQKSDAGDAQSLKIMINSDVDGTLEAILNVIDTYNSEKVALELVKFDVGPPSEADIKLAKDIGVLLYCFNIVVPPPIIRLAASLDVQIECFNVIYRFVEDLKNRLSACLPEITELERVGEGHVIKAFSVMFERKRQSVGGTLVDWGTIDMSNVCRVLRGDAVIYEGPIRSMKIGAQQVKTARTNEEVGIAVPQNFSFKEDDIIEAYREVKVKQIINWQPPGF